MVSKNKNSATVLEDMVVIGDVVGSDMAVEVMVMVEAMVMVDMATAMVMVMGTLTAMAMEQRRGRMAVVTTQISAELHARFHL